MNKRLSRQAFSFLLILLLLAPAPGLAADYLVIVHPTNPRSSLTLEELGKIFLKRILKWDTEIAIVPVDQVRTARVRILFTRIVHRKPDSALNSYWQQQIFSGRAVPPAEKADDDEVLAFVSAEPGAIGYVTPGASIKGVKVLRIR